MSLAAGDPPQLLIDELEQPAEGRAVAVAGVGEELRDVSGSFRRLGHPGFLHDGREKGNSIHDTSRETRLLIEWAADVSVGRDSLGLPNHNHRPNVARKEDDDAQN